MSNLPILSAVSDADGDDVRCRWASSSRGECAGVCQTFPATLTGVSSQIHIVCITLHNSNTVTFMMRPTVLKSSVP